jgi:hypothetical protein
LKEGNKSDRIDARKLAELLRTNFCGNIPKFIGNFFDHVIRNNAVELGVKFFLRIVKGRPKYIGSLPLLRCRECFVPGLRSSDRTTVFGTLGTRRGGAFDDWSLLV